MERSDIVAAHLVFLCTVHQIRVLGDKPLVSYLDKTWINQNHIVKFIWQEFASNDGLRVSASVCSPLK
jgi:hypothetical protein